MDEEKEDLEDLRIEEEVEEEKDYLGNMFDNWLELWFPSSSIRIMLCLVGGLPPFHPPFTSFVALCSPRVMMYHQGFHILAFAEGLLCGRLQEEPRYCCEPFILSHGGSCLLF